MKPIILISGVNGISRLGRPTFELNKEYAWAVRLGGGTPFLAIDPEGAAEYAEAADGLLLSGGKDISPTLYGETYEEETRETDNARDKFETSLIEAFLEREKPILGICRGFQLLNIYFGGTLWHDIPSRFGVDHVGGSLHSVKCVHGLTLRGTFGQKALVNSYHHQALRRLGSGLLSAAVAKVGDEEIVEAFQHESLPVLGVQWHPERAISDAISPLSVEGSDMDRPALTDMIPLFFLFANLCRGTPRQPKR